MRIDAIGIGQNPPQDVNVIVDVPVDGEPIKYELDKAASLPVCTREFDTPVDRSALQRLIAGLRFALASADGF